MELWKAGQICLSQAEFALFVKSAELFELLEKTAYGFVVKATAGDVHWVLQGVKVCTGGTVI